MPTNRHTPVRRQRILLLPVLLAIGILFAVLAPGLARSQAVIETLDNTQYTQDTTWTNDKVYVLAGSVIVGQGVTLTIQPGTVINTNPSKFIRIDGTLIAQGTAEQPIVFTTNSITNSAWSGIRFTDSAVNAAFDKKGVYQSGSILRYVDMSGADLGMNLAGRTPYIADSVFSGDNTAITW